MQLDFLRVCYIVGFVLTIINIVLLFLPFIIWKENTIDERRRLLDLHDFDYILPKTSCEVEINNQSTIPAFVAIIHTSPVHFKLRNALREAWFHTDPRMMAFFAIGKVASKTLQKQLNQEDAKHKDIIQGNFMDSYHNLTYKHSMVLKWFYDHCKNVDYLVKLDDDVFVNVPALIEFLQEIKGQNHSLMSHVRIALQPDRWGKWKILRNQLKDDRYPEHAFGPSIIYSNKFVREAYPILHTSRFFWVDDIFISGYIRQQLFMKVTSLGKRILRRHQWKDIIYGNSTHLKNPPFLFTWNEMSPENITTLGNKMRDILEYQKRVDRLKAELETD